MVSAADGYNHLQAAPSRGNNRFTHLSVNINFIRFLSNLGMNRFELLLFKILRESFRLFIQRI
jgi:hypothetical protein